MIGSAFYSHIMIKKSKVSGILLYVSLSAFILFAVYILYINREVLYTAHDRSEFLYGTSFFHTLMQKPFGLMQYVGAWLTQLFYEPALGAGVLLAVWVMIFFVGVKAFRLRDSASALMLLPVACLLTSIVDLGYWIYILPIRGYWFSQSVGYLTMLLLLWAARSIPCRSSSARLLSTGRTKWHLAWYLLAFCLYPLLGWFAMLFVLCLAFSERPTWRELLGIFLLVFTAGVWHTLLYSDQRLEDVVLAGLPLFVTPLDSSERLSLPFWLLGAASVLISLCGRYLAKWFVPLLSVAIGIVFTCSFMFRNQNYIDEIRMVRYAFDDNWKEVISMAEKNQKPTTTMVFLKNIALMNDGEQLERSFKSGNVSIPVYNPDTLHVTFLNIASPLVYYNYGLMNEAIRLNYETAIQEGFSPFYLKMLSRCALAKGDKELLKRYTALLHHHPFYSDWQPAPVSAKVSELAQSYPDEITGVENSDSYIVNSISVWHDTESKVASEQALFYAMISCDSHRFWPSLRNYLRLHEDEIFPLHAQEGYILFMDKAPEERRMMLPVEEDVYNRYKQFCKVLEKLVKPGKTIGQVAEEMRAEWGGTYWYYYYFGRQYTNSAGRNISEVQS